MMRALAPQAKAAALRLFIKPVLVERPEQWKWSSFRAYCYGETGPVRVRFQEWAPEIKRRPVESFAEVKGPLIRKANKARE
jgi:hypothetical protein